MREALVAFPIALPALVAVVDLDILEPEPTEVLRRERGVQQDLVLGDFVERIEPAAPAVHDGARPRVLHRSDRVRVLLERRIRSRGDAQHETVRAGRLPGAKGDRRRMDRFTQERDFAVARPSDENQAERMRALEVTEHDGLAVVAAEQADVPPARDGRLPARAIDSFTSRTPLTGGRTLAGGSAAKTRTLPAS